MADPHTTARGPDVYAGWSPPPEWEAHPVGTNARLAADLAAALAQVETLREALRLALAGIPDPMHPSIPPQFCDRLVSVQIVLADALGDDDPGNVDAARTTLAALAASARRPRRASIRTRRTWALS